MAIRLVQRLDFGFPWSNHNGHRTKVAIAGYDALKAAQFAAYLLDKAGGTIEKKRLSKFLYLGERESAATLGHPMYYDECFSIAEGPICTNALRGLNQQSDKATWSRYVERAKGSDLIRRRGADQTLDQLSEADVAIAEALWSRFGHMTTDQLIRWTHEQLPEYTETTSRLPISDEDMAKGIGLSSPHSYAESVADVRDMRASDPFA